MKTKFETFYRGLMVFFAAMLFWSFWASAQTNTNTNTAATNAPAAKSTNAPVINLLPDIDRAYLSFGLDQYPALTDHKLFGVELWQYIASLIYIFLAFYISKFLDYLTRVWLKNWAAKTKSEFDDHLLELLNGPIKVISFVIFLHIGLSVFNWPDFIEAVISKALKIVVAVSLTYMLLKLVDLVLGYWKQRAKAEEDKSFDEQLFPIIRKSFKVFVVIVAVLVTSSNLGVNITGMIASLSIGGLALGLAAQDTLANMFGAVAVFLDKPFRIGDRIQLDAVDGTVESIGVRSTRVRHLDGYLITVPNKTMGNATITNVTKRPNIKTVINLGLTYDTSPEKVKRALQILEEILKPHPMTFDLVIAFDKFKDFSLNIQVVHWWGSTDHKEYLKGMQAFNLAIMERFQKEGIEFAFPTQTLHVKREAEPAAKPPERPAI